MLQTNNNIIFQNILQNIITIKIIAKQKHQENFYQEIQAFYQNIITVGAHHNNHHHPDILSRNPAYNNQHHPGILSRNPTFYQENFSFRHFIKQLEHINLNRNPNPIH